MTLIIKIGGGEGISLSPILTELASLIRAEPALRVVLVHGGSHETNVLSERLGHPPRTITSPSGHTSRRTDRETLDIFTMVYCGRVNKSIVEHLQREGVNAVGLSGIDSAIWRGTRKAAIRAIEQGRTVIIRDDLSGTVDRVDADFLNLLLDAGRLPVLTPPAITDDGIAINVDADRAAARTAAALGADELLLLSNVPGVLRDPRDPGSLISRVDDTTIESARAAAAGRMKNKVLAAEEAMRGIGGRPVPRVVIGSANGESPIASARAGAGTTFHASPAGVA
ncbi:MAG: [LysW]-aminoadipate kinase [Phycisphaeraceae bacterium]|nr:MAG: [LysW]-aminoadipate kinase [Phycisphaeraceae bacterium]